MHSKVWKVINWWTVTCQKCWNIDSEVKRRFPEEFDDIEVKNDEEEKPQRTSRLSTVVAPARRSTSSKKIVLTKTQVALAKKFGLSPEQYARELNKLEA